MLERNTPLPIRRAPSSTDGRLAPVETDDQALSQARQRVANLAELAKADPGIVFQADTLEALAVLRAQDRETWARARQALQKAGIARREVYAELDQRTPRPRLRLVQPDEGSSAAAPIEPRTVGQALPDAPAPAKPLVIPDGYYLSDEATGYRLVAEDPETGEVVVEERPFAFGPMVITARLRDIDEGRTALRLAYRRADGWRELTVDRGVALHKGRILDLTSQDVLVASDNAHAVAAYLHRFEAVNYEQLVRLMGSGHLGWQGPNGHLGFLWGHTHLLPDGQTAVTASLEAPATTEWPAHAIAFRGMIAGDAHLVAGYRAAGTRQEWVEAIAGVRPYPKVCLALYASFVPPLLQRLGIPDFILH
jgi:hypothetical protein